MILVYSNIDVFVTGTGEFKLCLSIFYIEKVVVQVPGGMHWSIFEGFPRRHIFCGLD